MIWSLYVIRTVDGCLYAGITTDVQRRFQEHATKSPKAAKFMRARTAKGIVFTRRIGSRSMALKVEDQFKRLRKRQKEAIVRAGKLSFDKKSGAIRLQQQDRGQTLNIQDPETPRWKKCATPDPAG